MQEQAAKIRAEPAEYRMAIGTQRCLPGREHTAIRQYNVHRQQDIRSRSVPRRAKEQRAVGKAAAHRGSRTRKGAEKGKAQIMDSQRCVNGFPGRPGFHRDRHVDRVNGQNTVKS